jgi:hypothetical protein
MASAADATELAAAMRGRKSAMIAARLLRFMRNLRSGFSPASQEAADGEIPIDPAQRSVNNVAHMNRRAFLMLIVGLWLGVVSMVHAEPKAYDIIKFRGKAGAVTVAFDFAQGYSEASELHTVQGGKTTKFKMDSTGEGTMTFVPEKGSGKSVVVKINGEDIAPAKVGATYTSGGKAVDVTLTKGK